MYPVDFGLKTDFVGALLDLYSVLLGPVLFPTSYCTGYYSTKLRYLLARCVPFPLDKMVIATYFWLNLSTLARSPYLPTFLVVVISTLSPAARGTPFLLMKLWLGRLCGRPAVPVDPATRWLAVALAVVCCFLSISCSTNSPRILCWFISSFSIRLINSSSSVLISRVLSGPRLFILVLITRMFDLARTPPFAFFLYIYYAQ